MRGGGGKQGERKGKERAETEGVETREKTECAFVLKRLRRGDIIKKYYYVHVIVRFLFFLY